MNNETQNLQAEEIFDDDAEKIVGGATERTVTVYDFEKDEVYRHKKYGYYYHIWITQNNKLKSDTVEVSRFHAGDYHSHDLITVYCQDLIEDCTCLGVRHDYRNI